MNVSWSEHYNMGIDVIDSDHKQLFQIAGKIIQTVEDTGGMDEKARMFVVREGVKYLKNYFIEHAFREEAYMLQIQYQDYVAHKRLHDEFQYVQLARFEGIIERGVCTKNEVYDFIGTGIGWLLEHIATADMAIVGKGVLCRPAVETLNKQAIEEEVNRMFAATLNMDVDAKVLDLDYSGTSFGSAVYQKFLYQRDGQTVTVLAGIEKNFLVQVAHSIYGADLDEAEALILSSLEIFGAAFWRTLGERLIQSKEPVDYREGHFLSQKQVLELFAAKMPAVSVLFTSEKGRFFIASDDRSFDGYRKAV